jgi:hypothetical protein
LDFFAIWTQQYSPQLGQLFLPDRPVPRFVNVLLGFQRPLRADASGC